MRALAARVSVHSGTPTPVNIDGALAVALTRLRLEAIYGDFLFAIARSFGLAAHFVEEQARSGRCGRSIPRRRNTTALRSPRSSQRM